MSHCRRYRLLLREGTSEEKGLFEFGASTIILIFKKDLIEIDEDIVYYSSMGIETVVKYGSQIGTRRQ